MKLRGFEVAKGWEERDIHLPKRATAQAAGYDIEAAVDTVIPPYQPGILPTLIPTGLKAYCQKDECFLVFNRSSGPKRGLVLANGVGVIDADYYNNESNDGHFQILAYNLSGQPLTVKKGERIAQVVFQKFLTVDNDKTEKKRTGGIGSTN